ncbi:hypothetical protein [Mycobacterium montefiorense]|uniref:Uncharacterized protein n=1 Tax=Mycobacterium montefiorense TaxID=154654 RepID=A0AA37UUV2_9MYCO|nr:hypothetical protein [Mycobacterium montefiorense]GBG38757.1 hypothetical protein MmonteBS_31290 [Mycobacterium montefiorense]GKU34586.1 hypothetical protein NJB14191_19320 [Mycobacterium montefiorense]GKU39207.1 hypothetical protein NJB14192_12030 [Mycobacterium montefiorense]GKU43632.1 hypothetical protein NJB14194_02650 [Mycobacterium montefiorense]GKU49972.1 hypothetical protein NJB14195_12180 [Mycobacterium montefiorense]
MTNHEPPTNIDYLRHEVLARIDAHPLEDWSPAMLRAMIAVFDLNGIVPRPVHAFRTRIVK